MSNCASIRFTLYLSVSPICKMFPSVQVSANVYDLQARVYVTTSGCTKCKPMFRDSSSNTLPARVVK